PRNVRFETLVRLRWLAVFGQLAAVLAVHFGLEFDVPIWPCLAVIALSALVYLTGGLENPFSFLLLGPVLISATALPPRMTLLIGIFAMVCATVLVFFHYQLP